LLPQGSLQVLQCLLLQNIAHAQELQFIEHLVQVLADVVDVILEELDAVLEVLLLLVGLLNNNLAAFLHARLEGCLEVFGQG